MPEKPRAINWIALFGITVSLLVAFLAGAYGYGTLNNRVDTNETSIERTRLQQQKTMELTAKIDKNQDKLGLFLDQHLKDHE